MNEPFSACGLKKVPIVLKVVRLTLKKKWSTEAHDTWQIDGKEQIKLGNGQQVSWMNMADEGTTAHLMAPLHAKRTVAQIDPQAATWDVNACFERWGLPVHIKIDNGLPFVYPSARDVPTYTKLWWIGLGIKVIQNPPKCPQENGVVECLQGTICSWSNPKAYNSIDAFQQRIDEESDFQRNHYQIPAKGKKTRIELYPELEHNTRRYNPDDFDIKRVYEYLSEKVWTRTVRNSGEVKFFGQNIYVGKRYAKLETTIIFDPQKKEWRFSKRDGAILNSSDKGVPDEQAIKEFAMMSKN